MGGGAIFTSINPVIHSFSSLSDYCCFTRGSCCGFRVVANLICAMLEKVVGNGNYRGSMEDSLLTELCQFRPCFSLRVPVMDPSSCESNLRISASSY